MASAVLQWIENNLGYTASNGHNPLTFEDVETMVKGKEAFWSTLLNAPPRLHSVLAFRASESRIVQCRDEDPERGLLKEKVELVRKLASLLTTLDQTRSEVLNMQHDIESKRANQIERSKMCDKKRLQLMMLKCYKMKIEQNVLTMKEYVQNVNNAITAYHASRGTGDMPSEQCNAVTIKKIAAFCEAVVLNSDAQSDPSTEARNIFLYPINLEEFKGLKISKPRLMDCLTRMTNQSLATLNEREPSPHDAKLHPQSSGLPTLDELLSAEQAAHLAAFEEVESLRRQAAAKQAEVHRRVLDLEALHERMHPDDGERHLRSLVWKQDRDLAAARAALTAAADAADALRATVAAQREPWSALLGEFARLRERVAAREEAQGRFTTLLARNAATKRRLRRNAALPPMAAAGDATSALGSDCGPAAVDLASAAAGLRVALQAECRLLRSPDPGPFLDRLAGRPSSGPPASRDPFLAEVAAALGVPRRLAGDGLVAAAAAAASRAAGAVARADWARGRLLAAEGDPRRAVWCQLEAIRAAHAAVDKLDRVRPPARCPHAPRPRAPPHCNADALNAQLRKFSAFACASPPCPQNKNPIYFPPPPSHPQSPTNPAELES